jgi:hypothetical protein
MPSTLHVHNPATVRETDPLLVPSCSLLPSARHATHAAPQFLGVSTLHFPFSFLSFGRQVASYLPEVYILTYGFSCGHRNITGYCSTRKHLYPECLKYLNHRNCFRWNDNISLLPAFPSARHDDHRYGPTFLELPWLMEVTQILCLPMEISGFKLSNLSLMEACSLSPAICMPLQPLD